MAAWAAGLKAYGSCGCRGEAQGGRSDGVGRDSGRLSGMWDGPPCTSPSPRAHSPAALPAAVPPGRAAPHAAPQHPPLPCHPATCRDEGPGAHPGAMVIVVPHEGVEGAQLGPAHAQLLGRVARKAADVGTHQRHPEEVEEQHLCREGAEGVGAAQRGGHGAPGEAPGCGAGTRGEWGQMRPQHPAAYLVSSNRAAPSRCRHPLSSARRSARAQRTWSVR